MNPPGCKHRLLTPLILLAIGTGLAAITLYAFNTAVIAALLRVHGLYTVLGLTAGVLSLGLFAIASIAPLDPFARRAVLLVALTTALGGAGGLCFAFASAYPEYQTAFSWIGSALALANFCLFQLLFIWIVWTVVRRRQPPPQSSP